MTESEQKYQKLQNDYEKLVLKNNMLISENRRLAAAVDGFKREIASGLLVERKQGEWIKEYRGQLNYICSCCRKESGRRTDFCPKCGADLRMEEPE